MAGGWNGSGVYNRYYNWAQDAANAIPIMASRMDTEDTGFASGLSNCIAKDGQSTVTANIPFNNFKLTGVADATAVQDAMNQRAGDARYLLLTNFLSVAKTSDTSRSTTIVYTADPALVLTTIAAGTYAVELILLFDGGAGGLAWTFAYTGTVTAGKITQQGLVNGGAAANSAVNWNGTNSLSTISVAQSDQIWVQGTITVSTVGTLSFNWCQNLSNAAATNVRSFSRLSLRRIS